MPNYMPQNNYMPYYPMNNYAQYMPQQQQLTLNGKLVDSVDVVRATDIPMSNEMFYFPKADGSEIYVKNWLPTGQTQIRVYKPYTEPISDDTNNVLGADLKTQINALQEYTDSLIKRIEDRFDKLEKNIVSTKRNSAKKEVEEV